MQMPVGVVVIVVIVGVIVMVVMIVAGFHLEEAHARAAFAHFIERGFADAVDLDAQAQRHAGERVVAVEDHMVGVDIRHMEKYILRGGWVAAGRQAFKEHAFFKLLREFVARGDVDEFVDVIAKGVLRL